MCVSMWKHTWAKESAVTMVAGEETHAVAALVISDVHAISGSRGCGQAVLSARAGSIHPFDAQQTHGSLTRQSERRGAREGNYKTTTDK